MDGASSQELLVPDSITQPLLETSSSSTLNEALQTLIEISRSDDGRSNLATKCILPSVLELIQSLSRSSTHHLLLLSLRLLRNLCAGEAVNQNLFIEKNGVGIVLTLVNTLGSDGDDSGHVITRTALQVLANASLAGEKYQRAIWDQFFPDVFLQIARIRKRETCDPLCMIIYTCSDGSFELFAELCRNPGLAIMAEIIRTGSAVGLDEDWLKLLLSRICLEESHFPGLFTMLGDTESKDIQFTSEQAFLLQILSEILNERLEEIHVDVNFALYVLGIFESSTTAIDFNARGRSPLPTGCASIDVLGYSLTILRDLSAQDRSKEGLEDIVSSFVSKGLLDLLLSLLRELELPSSIRKTMKSGENQGLTLQVPKVCPYKGFRRDIVAVIGNCAYRRKRVQDEVREKNGVILVLQQCVLDEDNPYLREWGLWSARNLLEGNEENKQVVANLEMQRTLEVPELSSLGLRVEVDPNTRRAKLVNIT